MLMNMKIALSVAALGLGAVALSGCSSEASVAPVSTPSASTSSAPSTAPMPGSDPATWSPVVVSAANTGTTIDVMVGQKGYFGIGALQGDFEVMSSDPMVVAPSQPGAKADMTQFDPGFDAVGPGTATVSLWDKSMSGSGSGPVYSVTINVA